MPRLWVVVVFDLPQLLYLVVYSLLPILQRGRFYLLIPSGLASAPIGFDVGACLHYTTRSEGGYASQFSDLSQFLNHQKIFYKTCICAGKLVLNFQLIRNSGVSFLTIENTNRLRQ